MKSLETFNNLIDQKVFNLVNQKLVVFDLDGTLIDGDLGEAVFYLLLISQALGYSLDEFDQLKATVINQQEILSGENSVVAGFLQAYLASLDKGNFVDAYKITAEYCLNFPREKVQLVTQKVLEIKSDPVWRKITIGKEIFNLQIHANREPLMSSLPSAFLDKGAILMILSASPQWVVEAFCLNEGIPVACAFGARRDGNGKIDVPYGKRKLEIIHTHDTQQPYIVFGNSQGDLEMLEAAVMPFVRRTSQTQLLNKAKRLHWHIL